MWSPGFVGSFVSVAVGRNDDLRYSMWCMSCHVEVHRASVYARGRRACVVGVSTCVVATAYIAQRY